VKKIVCILVMACVVMGAVFAQAKPATPAPATPAPAAPAAPAASASAAKVKSNAISMDFIPLFRGLFYATDTDINEDYIVFPLSVSYERLLVPHFSIGGNVDLYIYKLAEDYDGDDIPGLYFSMAAEGRYYPMAAFDKLFFGTTFGFNAFSVDGKTKTKDGGFAGLLFSVKTGYKVVMKNIIYLEPSLSYVMSKDSIYSLSSSSFGDLMIPGGWTAALRFGVTF